MDDGQPSAELPEESETLTDKMSRYFSNEASSVSMVPPSNSSYLTKNIFTDDHRKYLLKVCGSMVKSGIISKTVVKDLLSKDEEGKEMLREFTIKQLINRLKYERRLNRRKWTNSATCQTTYFCMSLLDLQSVWQTIITQNHYFLQENSYIVFIFDLFGFASGGTTICHHSESI